MLSCQVQSPFLLSGDACDCKYCFKHCRNCCSESPVWVPRKSLAMAICKGIKHNKNKFSLAFSYSKTALMYWCEKKKTHAKNRSPNRPATHTCVGINIPLILCLKLEHKRLSLLLFLIYITILVLVIFSIIMFSVLNLL